MKNQKYTPGPWVVDEIGPPHEYTRYVVRAEGRGQIMQTPCHEDALLIASAPEMLSVISDLIHVVDPYNTGGMQHQRDVIARAKSIIEKATDGSKPEAGK